MKKIILFVAVVFISGITAIVAQQSTKPVKSESGERKFKYCLYERTTQWNVITGATAKTTQEIFYTDGTPSENVAKEYEMTILKKLGEAGWELTGTVTTSGDAWRTESYYFKKSY